MKLGAGVSGALARSTRSLDEQLAAAAHRASAVTAIETRFFIEACPFDRAVG
ncbi:hypothetical protein AKJ09_07771 [Labilithrix luteola]|uniref:Uncharacterized protein n=1 Tax=Labilithrix luteola TaxID=1391654 RepID=A0A0K1Q5U3_9BACT|nr:hypothetical protein AKJ09_07771 [Labilithrix luteola]